MQEIKFSAKRFFVNNINSWLFIFDKHHLLNKKLIGLEIGSYEGRSSLFILKFLDKIKLTCVDTFKPFHELKEYNEKNLIKSTKILKQIPPIIQKN